MNKTPINDGGPAFPVSHPSIEATTPESAKQLVGMTLRDWFAGMALQGLMAHPEIGNTIPDEKIAKFAWSQADAMLAARERKEDA